MSELPVQVEIRNATKAFGGVRALEDVSFSLRAGEVVGLLGHNGAGKSTLVRALSGAGAIDSGQILVAGAPVTLAHPRDARAAGIETLYQDLALAEPLDAVANLYLGRELVSCFGRLDEDAMERDARTVLARVNPELVQLRRPVRDLSGGQRQAVAFARALLFDAQVLILDEPTAALGPGESAAVAAAIGRMRDQGLAILVVSHDLHGVFELADRLVVMRRGRVVSERAKSETSQDEVLRSMIAGH